MLIDLRKEFDRKRWWSETMSAKVKKNTLTRFKIFRTICNWTQRNRKETKAIAHMLCTVRSPHLIRYCFWNTIFAKTFIYNIFTQEKCILSRLNCWLQWVFVRQKQEHWFFFMVTVNMFTTCFTKTCLLFEGYKEQRKLPLCNQTVWIHATEYAFTHKNVTFAK